MDLLFLCRCCILLVIGTASPDSDVPPATSAAGQDDAASCPAMVQMRSAYAQKSVSAELSGRAEAGSGLADYETFLRDVGTRRPREDNASVLSRIALFQQRHEAVRRHNAQAGISWTAAVNKFADFTEAEFRALLGHVSARRMGLAAPVQPASLLQAASGSEELAESMDWREALQATAAVPDQGDCGSCWAVAAAGALQAHAEIAGLSNIVSYEELTDCAPNPQHCGGTGGCDGSTPELAFAYVKDKGVASKSDYKGYQSGGGKGHCHARTASTSLTVAGYVRLETNRLQPLLHAVAKLGPVAVAADATEWGIYGDGIFDNCPKDAIVNHAILLMGYGTDKTLQKDYWLIRNSWADDWGEEGYMRLLRHADENSYCGVDTKPQEGVGCKGGPATLPVCGMCGILSDATYPTGVQMAA